MLLVRRLPIAPDETGGSLHDRLSVLGAEALMEALPGIEAGTLAPRPQDDALATYAKKLQKAEALIDWALPAPAIERSARIQSLGPVAETRLDGEALRVWRRRRSRGQGGAAVPWVAVSRDGIRRGDGDGPLRILELQHRTAGHVRPRLPQRRDLSGVLLG